MHGLDPDAEIPVAFLEPTRKLGANRPHRGQVHEQKTDQRQTRTVPEGGRANGRP